MSRFYVALRLGQKSVRHARMPPIRSSMLNSGFEIILKLPIPNLLHVGPIILWGSNYICWCPPINCEWEIVIGDCALKLRQRPH